MRMNGNIFKTKTSFSNSFQNHSLSKMSENDHNKPSPFCKESESAQIFSIIIRFTCIGLAIISNITAFIYLYYKLYHTSKREIRQTSPHPSTKTTTKLISKWHSSNVSPYTTPSHMHYSKYHKRCCYADSMDNSVIYGTFAYIILATITVTWNVVYRYLINHKIKDCIIADTIDEYLNVISRVFLLLFFTCRVELIFKNSIYRFNKCMINIFRVLAVSEDFLLNTAWIVHMKVCPVTIDQHIFGVYCYNAGNEEIIYLHFCFDAFFNLCILLLFVDRLLKVSNLIGNSPQQDKKFS